MVCGGWGTKHVARMSESRSDGSMEGAKPDCERREVGRVWWNGSWLRSRSIDDELDIVTKCSERNWLDSIVIL